MTCQLLSLQAGFSHFKVVYIYQVMTILRVWMYCLGNFCIILHDAAASQAFHIKISGHLFFTPSSFSLVPSPCVRTCAHSWLTASACIMTQSGGGDVTLQFACSAMCTCTVVCQIDQCVHKGDSDDLLCLLLHKYEYQTGRYSAMPFVFIFIIRCHCCMQRSKESSRYQLTKSYAKELE